MPVVKLSFGDVLSESFGFFFANLRLFFHLVTIPWILSLAIRILGCDARPRIRLVAVLVEKALDVDPDRDVHGRLAAGRAAGPATGSTACPASAGRRAKRPISST